ncbi:MAG: polyhydroxyalkanoic acid synthase [Vitreoscilla sp.]|nr:polyhydroxyalkanoic acid synthase [Vitreoscilla sp.]
MTDLPLTITTDAADHRALRAAQAFDSRLHATVAQATLGLSPIALALAATDWALHLASQPAQAAYLASLAFRQATEVAAHCREGDDPGLEDPRFAHPAWRQWPWAPAAWGWQAFQGWVNKTTRLRGMQPHHQELAGFMARQCLDMLSPSNAGLANPEVLQRTLDRRGANLIDGWTLAVDQWRWQHGLGSLQPDKPDMRPGQDLAMTPGRVVFRNHLVELIQYLPLTASVHAEPVFIVPSWIMKYYILDLSPRNSLVRWLVEQGHTVFMVSWRNPDAEDAALGMADYLQQGVFEPLEVLADLVPAQAVHACGYCLGGTLLAIAAAALARPGGVQGQDRMATLASVTLLAAETDFSEPGEMGVLIDESQVTLLEDLMARQGYLSGEQMAGSFAFLHARDQVWSQRLRTLWLGEPAATSDLMAWNADVTRMPAAMHGEYLRRCYLRNELAEGRYPVQGHPVALSDIQVPMFVVGTETDHVAPWRSVYQIHRLCAAEITFVLTSGGHNAGIVSEPGHANRHHAVCLRPAHGAWVEPASWEDGAERHEGSWWPTWDAWLARHGSGKQVKARTPRASSVLGDAPGDYVLVRHGART